MNGNNPVAVVPPYDPWWYSFWARLWEQGDEDADKDDPDLKEVPVCHRRTL